MLETKTPVLVSIVVPVYNEAENIVAFHQKICEVMAKTPYSFELLFVDDGSKDASVVLLDQICRQDERVRMLVLSRNFGHQIAVTAGLDYARGDAVVVIDADLQDPPEVILDLVAKWREGYEVVYAVRAERKGETWFKEFTAKAFYRIIFSITDINIPMDTGDFRLMDRKVVEALKTMKEKHRFMRGMSVWVGFRQVGVNYVRAERYAGETKYPLKKMLKFAMDGITSFSYFPLQLATFVGFVAAALAILGIIATVILRLTGSHAFYGQASTLVAVLFLGGVQLIFLGIIGEYLGRIYDEVKGRPLYIVREALGFDRAA